MKVFATSFLAFSINIQIFNVQKMSTEGPELKFLQRLF